MDTPQSPGRIDRFLACLQTALGHELSNRLVTLQGLLRILDVEAADQLDAKQRDYLRRVGSLARRSNALIGELYQMVRVVRMPQPASEIDLPELIREVAAEVKHLCPTATVEYHVLADCSRLKLSVLLLRQILVQLVKSLVQLAGPGRPLRIEVAASQQDERRQLVVRDNGPGWPAERLAQAFEPFVGRLASEADTGLGLYPVRHLVEGWGGTIAIESAPNQGGTTFTIAWKDDG